MASDKKRIYRSSANGTLVVGAKASESISKVEGLSLSKDMRAMFRDFDRKGMSADARCAALLGKYGKKSG
jgi:5S rRNA maturation endonuclease (ribonuclease M5)